MRLTMEGRISSPCYAKLQPMALAKNPGFGWLPSSQYLAALAVYRDNRVGMLVSQRFIGWSLLKTHVLDSFFGRALGRGCNSKEFGIFSET
jgi:hypothetical protein